MRKRGQGEDTATATNSAGNHDGECGEPGGEKRNQERDKRETAGRETRRFPNGNERHHAPKRRTHYKAKERRRPPLESYSYY